MKNNLLSIDEAYEITNLYQEVFVLYNELKKENNGR